MHWPGAGFLDRIAMMKMTVVIFAAVSFIPCFDLTATARSPWLPQADLPEARAIHAPGDKRELGPANVAMLNRALGHLKIGQYKKALTLLNDVLDARPDCAPALRARARILLTMGYLYWKEPMVRQGIKDAEKFLWINDKDVAVGDLLTLLRQLRKRMKRLAPANKVKKTHNKKSGNQFGT